MRHKLLKMRTSKKVSPSFRWEGNTIFPFTVSAVRMLTLIMFMGPKTLVLKAFSMSSELVSSRGLLIRIPALLISRLIPSAPTRESTCWAHSFMLQRSEVSDQEREKAEQQSFL